MVIRDLSSSGQESFLFHVCSGNLALPLMLVFDALRCWWCITRQIAHTFLTLCLKQYFLPAALVLAELHLLPVSEKHDVNRALL